MYLLSTAEAVREDYGFDSELRDDSETRAATATAYASSNGDLKKWYLLTRGLSQMDTVYVKDKGGFIIMVTAARLPGDSSGCMY